MNLSINGQSQVPPGFRFHPTEEELLHYYLRKKVACEKIDLDVIQEVDLNKLEPWDIQEKCKIGSTPQNDWYFFSHKDKKYPTGTRTNRATAVGFWKATGRDKLIYSGFKRIGSRKTLVFYKGRAPHGQKSDWIMHEYRLDENTTNSDTNACNSISESSSSSEDGWVVCRVFRKKNYQKALDQSPKGSSSNLLDSKMSTSHHHHHEMLTSNDGVLDQILMYMGNTCKMEPFINNMQYISNHNININGNNMLGNEALQERFMHLPRLQSLPSFDHGPIYNNNHSDHSQPFDHDDDQIILGHNESTSTPCDDGNDKARSAAPPVNDWVVLDRLVASQLNGPVVFSPDDNDDDHINYHFHKSSSDHQNNMDVPTKCLLYYFEMYVLNVGAKGQLAIGFTIHNFNMRRQSDCGYHGDDGGGAKGEPFGPTFTTSGTVGVYRRQKII
ncbi:hypothetical protein ACFE04_007468 [Oxalis oulophora]